MNENKVCSSEGNIEGFLYRKNLFLYPDGAESCRFCLTLQTMKGEEEKKEGKEKRGKRRGRKKGRKKMRKKKGGKENRDVDTEKGHNQGRLDGGSSI